MSQAVRPTHLRFEHHPAGDRVLGSGTGSPRLSWQLEATGEKVSDPRDVSADPVTGYEVEVDTDGATSQYQGTGPDQVLVAWPAPPLTSRQAASVRVRVRLDDDWTDWSDPAEVECGLLDPSDWTARFITPATGGGFDDPAPLLRTNWELPGAPGTARLYLTALGCYRATINGHRVGDEELAPGWTSYHHRLRYQTHDVSDLLVAGTNTIEITLGQGWYRGRLGFTGQRAQYGQELAALVQLEATVNGERQVLASGATPLGEGGWQAGATGILDDDLYDGQRTDLRVTEVECRDAVRELEVDLGTLVAPVGPPVRITEVIPATRVFTSPSGKTLVDFGQNLVGWVRLRVRNATPGTEVMIRHAEVLEHDELGVRPLRTAKATDHFYLAGGPEEVLEPCFTFHGFRYAEVTGIEAPDVADIEGVVIGSDLTRTGWFDSSHDQLNQLHENVVWGTRGNFVDVPTDCPQRDERLGWTGDIEVFAPSASFLFDTAGFLDNWLSDLAVDQHADGGVPYVIPSIQLDRHAAAAAWSDAACIVPWVLYERFGDAGILARQLPSMRAWVDKVTELAGPDRLWSGGFQFGDWLDPTAPPEDAAAAQADPDVVATAYFARSAQILADAAAVVGDEATARRYAELAGEVRAAFAREYVTDAGRILSDAPTVYAQAIAWALLPTAEQREHAGRRLADLVRTAGFRIATGFVGTPLMTDALIAAGEPEVAYRLLLQTGCPSWLYPVTMGATTIWERWDSMLPDGTINPGQMTSFNHYALGAVADWLHRSVAGLAPAAPGYRELTIAPLPHAALTHASARHLTPYGESVVAWRRADGTFSLEVTVPIGVRATVRLPDGSDPVSVGAGTHQFTCTDPCTAPSGGLPENATVRDVLDDPDRWAALIAVMEQEHDGIGEAELSRRLSPYFTYPAAAIADHLPGRRSPERRDALRRRVTEVLA